MTDILENNKYFKITKKAQKEAIRTYEKARLENIKESFSFEHILSMVYDEVGHINKNSRFYIRVTGELEMPRAYKYKKTFHNFTIEFNRKGEIVRFENYRDVGMCRPGSRGFFIDVSLNNLNLKEDFNLNCLGYDIQNRVEEALLCRIMKEGKI